MRVADPIEVDVLLLPSRQRALAKQNAESFTSNWFEKLTSTVSLRQRGAHHRIAEDLSPFTKAPIIGQDHRTALIAGIGQLEQQISAIRASGQ